MASRISQEVAEAVLQPSPNVRGTQEVLEVVLLPGTAGNTAASAGQAGTAEVATGVTASGGTAASAAQDGTAVLIAAGSGDTQASASQSGTAYLPGARITQEVLEVVAAAEEAAGPNARVSQEVLEAVVDPGTALARVSQEVLEVVVVPGTTGNTTASAGQAGAATLGEAPAGWTVNASPQVFWTGEVPVHAWAVITTPRVSWDPQVTDTTIRWFVNCAPKVSYVTGPGTASTECISAPGVVPPPDEEPPESLEQNYVF